MLPASSRIALVCSALVLAAPLQSHALTYTKADNATNLGNSGSWLVGTGSNPQSTDIALFNSTLTTAQAAGMGAARTWGQIQVTNPGGTFTINAGQFLNIAGINGVGIDMSAATADFIFNVTSTLTGNQTWNIGSGRTLTIGSGAITQAGTTLALAGAGTLNKTGAAALTLSSGTGSFTGNLRAGGGVTTLNSGALGSGGTLSFTSGTVAYGAGNTDDISARIVSSTSAIVLDTGGNNVTLGALASSNTGGLTKVGSGTLTLSAANSYTGTTTLNSAAATAAIIIGDKNAFSSGQVFITGGSALISASTDLTGANKVMNNFTLGNNLTNSTTAASLEYGGNFNLNGTAKSITNNSVNSTTTFSGVISNDLGAGLTFVTTGTIALTGVNTYTGATEFRGARALLVSQIGDIGEAGNLGAGSVLRFGSASATGAVLRYTGAGEETNRNLELNSTVGSITIDNASTGLLHFSGTTTTTAAGAKTLNLIASNSGTGRLDGSLADNGGALSLAKSGTGTWILAGNNVYTGTTTVTAGTLIINGSNVSSVAVSSGATFSGSGSTTGSVTVAAGGILAPGNSPGILSTGNLSLAGSLAAEVGKTGGVPVAGTDYDQVNVTGTVNLTGGDLALSILSGVQTGDLYFLIANDGEEAITGFFASLNGVGATLTQDSVFNVGANYFQISYTANSGGNSFTGGNDLALLAVVPEPSTWALLGMGLGALVWRARARRCRIS